MNTWSKNNTDIQQQIAELEDEYWLKRIAFRRFMHGRTTSNAYQDQVNRWTQELIAKRRRLETES
jgi:hypothetical protein